MQKMMTAASASIYSGPDRGRRPLLSGTENGCKWASDWRRPAAVQPVSHVPFPRQIIALDEETEHSLRLSMVCGSIPNAESNWRAGLTSGSHRQPHNIDHGRNVPGSLTQA